MRKIKITCLVSAIICSCLIHGTANAQVGRQQKNGRQSGLHTQPSVASQRAKYQEIVNDSKKVFTESENKSAGQQSNLNRSSINRPVTPMANRTSTNSKQSYQQLVQNLQKKNESMQAQQISRPLARTNTNLQQKKTYSYYVQKAEAERQQMERDRARRMQ